MLNQVPLQTYLSMLMLSYASSGNALQILRRGSLNLSPELVAQGKKLQQKIREHDHHLLETELHNQLESKFSELFSAVNSLNEHSYDRTLAEALVLWEEGSTRLLEFAADARKKAPVVLCIPSLINRSYILDLSEKRSFMRYLSAQGVDAYMVDWGEPLADELAFDLDDYIAGRLDRIVAFVHAHTGRPVVLLGYCMGGVMSLASALRNRDKVRALALLATPWDFHAPGFARLALPEVAVAMLGSVIDSMGKVHASIIQSMFYYLHPDSVQQKFESFTSLMKGDEDILEEFMAVEHWINDGISMTRGVAKACFIDWAHHNVLLKGQWMVGGMPVDPRQLDIPVLCIMAQKDHIVPPTSTAPLLKCLPNVKPLMTDLGHISMVVGSKARKSVWEVFVGWLEKV